MKKTFILLIFTIFFIKIPFLNAECEEIKDFVNEEKFVYITEMDEEEPYIFINI